MLRAGKTQLPADLLNDSDDVITFDQSQAPCGDDEDNCAGSGSGEEFLDDRPQNKGTFCKIRMHFFRAGCWFRFSVNC